MQDTEAKRKRQLSEYQSEKPPKVKIIFYSLTRIEGVRKRVTMNGPMMESVR